MRTNAKYRVREGRVSFSSGNVRRAFIAERLVTIFGIQLFYWPCENADWRLDRDVALGDVRRDINLLSPLSRPLMLDTGATDLECPEVGEPCDTAAASRLPYELRLTMGKALDRLVCNESTPEQVDSFVNVFAEFGLSIVFTDELQRLHVDPRGKALNRALDFIESLTDTPFLIGDDIEGTIDDIRDHARIELASIRKMLAASQQPKEHTP